MTLQDICVSLQLARELKKAGYTQESTFYWTRPVDDFGKASGRYFLEYKESVCSDEGHHHNLIAAPTCAEIGERLPIDIIGDEGMRFDINIYRDGGGDWVVGYWWDEDSRRKSGMVIENIADKSLASAMAKMWLYLKKQGLLAPRQTEEER